VELLPWDTDFFGVTIGRARVQASDEVETEIGAARAAGVECLYVVVAQADGAATGSIVKSGGVLTALRIVHERTGDPALTRPSSVREAGVDDEARVVDMSRSLAGASRFAQDLRFTRGRIEEMYRLWAVTDLRDGDVFVGTDGGGMVTMSTRDDTAVIGLVYVDPAARGTGLGRALLSAAVGRANERTVTVATDARNLAALRLYEAAGFRARSIDAILHLWLDERS
jgi:dTDP-4-amino-4,6-dideoxy-D-galactose acyltransferase